MEVTIKVTEGLAAEAKAHGMDISAYIERLLAERAALQSNQPSPRTAQEIRIWLDALAHFSDRIPPLPENISREWLYQDRD